MLPGPGTARKLCWEVPLHCIVGSPARKGVDGPCRVGASYAVRQDTRIAYVEPGMHTISVESPGVQGEAVGIHTVTLEAYEGTTNFVRFRTYQ